MTSAIDEYQPVYGKGEDDRGERGAINGTSIGRKALIAGCGVLMVGVTAAVGIGPFAAVANNDTAVFICAVVITAVALLAYRIQR